MSDWRIHTLPFVTVEQAGAWGTPTHWRIKREGELIATADNELDALTIGLALNNISADDWLPARKWAIAQIDRKDAA